MRRLWTIAVVLLLAAPAAGLDEVDQAVLDAEAERVAVMAEAKRSVLAIFSAGAYGFTMASQYNARPRPPEVLVDGEDYQIIRRRETYEDLTAAESEPL